MASKNEDSRTMPVNIGICKIEDGRICIYGLGDYPEAAFAALMTPKNAQTFAKLVTAVVDERVPAGCSTYIRAEQVGYVRADGGRKE